MDGEAVRTWCLSRPGASEGFPFGPDTLVYKVGGKMFALVPHGRTTVNLKCVPHLAEVLREQFPGSVTPGYHMNKRHWNTVALDGTVPDDEMEEMLGHSYTIVVDSLPPAIRSTLREG